MKKLLMVFLILSIMLPLSACGKTDDVSTPLGEAYNSVNKSKRRIPGYNKDCIVYNSYYDTLELFPCPDMDYAALFGIMEEALAGRKVNTIELHNYTDQGWEPIVEPMLEAFSLYFHSPLKRLVLPEPRKTIVNKVGPVYRVEQPELWRDSLERLSTVDEVVLGRGNNIHNYKLFYDIADGDQIQTSFDIVVMPDGFTLDLSGLEVFSGLKRIMVDKPNVYTLDLVEGFEKLDPAKTQFDLSAYRGGIRAATFAFDLRAAGFTVTGISENPRDDLQEKDLAVYDSFVDDRQSIAMLAAGSTDFSEDLDNYFALSSRRSGRDTLEAGITLLQRFYSLVETDSFLEYLERMSSYDPELEAIPHTYILNEVCQALRHEDDFERFLTDVADRLPMSGSWCKTEISIYSNQNKLIETNAVNALMEGYERFMNPAGNKRSLDEEQTAALLDRIDQHGLLCGGYNSRYFTGDAEQDIKTAAQLLDAGRVTYNEAYSMMTHKAGNGMDAFLQATVQWDEAFDRTVERKYITAEEPLSADDSRLERSRFTSTSIKEEPAMGRKALFAYEVKDQDGLRFPKDAYRWFNVDGEEFRGIPPQNTPGSAEEAELLLIARLDGYQYAFEYTDGTKGYRGSYSLHAFDIATGECLGYLGTVVSEPATSLPAGARYDVYPGPDLIELFKLSGNWLSKE